MFITARLTVDGVELPVAGFKLTAPAGAMGASLQVGLALPDVTPVPPGAAVTFEIGIGAGSPRVYSWVTVLGGGKLAGRSYVISWQAGSPGRPGDVVEFNALNPTADRWGLAPRRPVILFDPEKVDAANLVGDPARAIRTEEGAPILPVLEPVAGLTLRQVLERAYTDRLPALTPQAKGIGEKLTRDVYAESTAIGAGCGFNNVVTNLPNFPVERVDFTLAGGWHGGASGLYSIYEPIIFEHENTLYIIDPDRGLPVGFTPRSLPLGCIISANHTVEPRQIVNALILQYISREPVETSAGSIVVGALPSERFIEDTPVESGTGKGYSRTEVTRKVREWTDIQTGQIVLAQELQVETRTYAYRKGGVKLISTETVLIQYQGKLKVGHTKTVEAVYSDPLTGGSDKFAEVLAEVSRIEWKPDFISPGESIQTRSITETRGVVLVERAEDNVTKIYTPILDAERGGLILKDKSQSTESLPIRTVLEQLRETGVNQADIETRIIDHLTGQLQTTVTQSRTGSRSTSSGRTSSGAANTARTVEELITDEVSIGAYGFRRAATLNVAELDPVEGRRVARRRLYRLANPRRSFSASLPGIDFRLRRGSVVKPPLRSGFDVNFIITGYTITGRALGTSEQRISMDLDGTELG